MNLYLYHSDALLGTTGLDECIECRRRFPEIIKAISTERNYVLFFRRHDITGRKIARWEQIGPEFKLSSQSVRHHVRATWRKFAAYHLRKCKSVSYLQVPPDGNQSA